MDDLRSIIEANSRLNSCSIENKVFCIGLHKQGTRSLAELATLYGYKSIHATGWHENLETLEENDFFSDGGSHFEKINELPYQRLALDYPHSLFILQTRDPLQWLLSKLAHAGWSEITQPIKGDPNEPLIHQRWRDKTLTNIDRFLIHKRNYEFRVESFFRDYFPNRLLVIDITAPLPSKDITRRIEDFLGVKSAVPLTLPHLNMRRTNTGPVVSEEVNTYIVKRIREIFGHCSGDP